MEKDKKSLTGGEKYDSDKYPYTALMNMGIDELMAKFPFVERQIIERLLKMKTDDLIPENCRKEFAAKVKDKINEHSATDCKLFHINIK